MAEVVRVCAGMVAEELKKRERGWLLVAVVAYELPAGLGEFGISRGVVSMRELYFEREPQ